MDLPQKTKHQKRVVIVGAGFAGLTLAKKLSARYFQVVLIDKNNYHQFQPLLYQVATAGLEANSISFPLRKIFQHKKNITIRIATVLGINTDKKRIATSVGTIGYDYLVLAQGAATNFFGMQNVQQHAYSMKSVSEALLLRNTLLQNYEQAVTACNSEQKAAYLNIVIVGGGPTGVELAGAIAEMKDKILPKDYPELDFSLMHIHLMEAAPRLLNGMSEASGAQVLRYLTQLGVQVHVGTSVKDYNGHTVQLSNGNLLHSRCLIWAAGVKGERVEGLPQAVLAPGNRLLVDSYNRLKGFENIFALGDVACMQQPGLPKGHPQVAPIAMQQARLLARNLHSLAHQKPLQPFEYKNKGSMAIVGRNQAVAEMGSLKMKGYIAWMVWLLVHLMSIVGIKNRLFVFINWVWQYVTYDQSLRLIIKPAQKENKTFQHEKKQPPAPRRAQYMGL